MVALCCSLLSLIFLIHLFMLFTVFVAAAATFLISHYCHFPFSLLFLLPFAFCCCRCDFLLILVYYDPRMRCFPPMMNYRHHHHLHCYCCYSVGVLYHSADSRANKAHVVSLAKEHDFHWLTLQSYHRSATNYHSQCDKRLWYNDL